MTAKARSVLDASSGDPVAVLTWLAQNPIPPGSTPQFARWKREACGLGNKAIPPLLHALQWAPPDVQYTAQIALRLNGVEVWAHGYGEGLVYEVKAATGVSRRVVPIMKDAAVALSSPKPAVAREETPTYGDDRFDAILDAGREIESLRKRMSDLAEVRSRAVKALLEAGISRAQIAKRLDVHPNYVNQLAKPRE